MLRRGDLWTAWNSGEEVTTKRHGRAVARLVPAAYPRHRQEAAAALSGIRERAERQGAAFDWTEWNLWRDGGRP